MAKTGTDGGAQLPALDAVASEPLAVDPLLPLVVPLDDLRAGILDASVKTVRRQQVQLVMRSWPFRIGALILLIWIGCALFGGMFRPEDPLAQDLLAINRPPSGSHLFGTDNLGRDVFSRVVIGARQVLIVAPLATILATAFGTVLGLLQGYYRGALDAITGRIVEAFLALPSIIVAFVFVVALGPSNGSLIAVVGFAFGLAISRTVRSAVLQELELDYVAAARLRGEGALHTMFVEIQPNVLSPIIVEFTVRLGFAINTVAVLSFLGFGIQPPTPDWGADIAANAHYLSAGFWWQTLFPALAIASLITSINLMGDSIESKIQ